MAGIGCHYMLAIGMERNTTTFTHMGAEGATWVGASHFTDMPHVFQNLGDGTYFHSGFLAIRAAVAANVNITYKILYNDAVAMTGGQPLDGNVDPWTISQPGRRPKACAASSLVTDEPDKYPVGTDWAPGVTVHHRDELDDVQRELREVKGVSVLIYDQTCAAEKRRRRKRGTFPDPAKRVFINEAVCEGCGDCSVQSNCLSRRAARDRVRPQARHRPVVLQQGLLLRERLLPELRHGRRRRRCRKGKADRSRRRRRPNRRCRRRPSCRRSPTSPTACWSPASAAPASSPSAPILGMAAHIEGKGVIVLDQLGLAQKGGAVMQHVRIGATPEATCTRCALGAGGANLVLGCDLVVTASADALATHGARRTRTPSSTRTRPSPATSPAEPDLALPGRHARRLSIEARPAPRPATSSRPTELATALMGDSIATNMFMLGYACQKGLIPLGTRRSSGRSS